MKEPTAAARRALLYRLGRRHRPVLGRAVLGGVLWQLAGIVVPVVIGWTVQAGVVEGDRGAIWWGGLALVGLGAVEALGAAIRHRAATTALMLANADLRAELAAAALELDDDGRRRFPPGEVVARATSDAETVGNLFDCFGHTVAQALSVPVILGILLAIDPLLAGVVAVTVPVTGLVMWRASIEWERRAAAAQRAMGTTVERAQEAIEGFRTIRGLGVEAAAVARLAGASADTRDRATAVGRLWLVYEPVLDALSVLAVAAVLFVGGGRVIDDAVPLGGVVAAVGLVLFLSGPVRVLGERVLTVQSALASAGRVLAVLEAGTPAADDLGPDPFPDRAGLALRATGLEVAPLLGTASFELPAGATVLLDGPTGSGKTTLLAAVAGLRPVAAGTVELGGLALDRWPAGALRRRVVLCGPSPFTFATTVEANLRFAAPAASAGELAAALAATACDFVDDLPEGLASVVGERGVSLSGGQRQRLALARTALGRPSVLLLDGATSALDPATEVAVLAGLRALLPATTLVVVSVHPGAETAADLVLAIEAGRVLAR